MEHKRELEQAAAAVDALRIRNRVLNLEAQEMQRQLEVLKEGSRKLVESHKRRMSRRQSRRESVSISRPFIGTGFDLKEVQKGPRRNSLRVPDAVAAEASQGNKGISFGQQFQLPLPKGRHASMDGGKDSELNDVDIDKAEPQKQNGSDNAEKEDSDEDEEWNPHAVPVESKDACEEDRPAMSLEPKSVMSAQDSPDSIGDTEHNAKPEGQGARATEPMADVTEQRNDAQNAGMIQVPDYHAQPADATLVPPLMPSGRAKPLGRPYLPVLALQPGPRADSSTNSNVVGSPKISDDVGIPFGPASSTLRRPSILSPRSVASSFSPGPASPNRPTIRFQQDLEESAESENESIAGVRRGSLTAQLLVAEVSSKSRKGIGPGMQTQQEGEEEDDEDEGGNHEQAILMLPIWKQRRKYSVIEGSRISRVVRDAEMLSWDRKHMNDMEKDDEDEDSWWVAQWIQQRLVANPRSSKRLVWDVIGILLIAYDIVFIPFQVFNPPSNNFTSFMSMFGTVFWTADIPLSFLVGFHSEGIIRMKLSSIARQYLQTWLFFDALVIGIDWALTVMSWLSDEEDTNGASSVGYMRLGKTIKFLRLLRLLRLFKAHGVVNDLLERIQSEWCLIMVGILKLLVLIMCVNHIVACAWYGIGTVDEGRDERWVYTHIVKLDRTDLGYRYITALHWSLTQFTPASMEVTPENTFERLFAVFVITFAMVIFSSFVSTITNAMTQLRNLNREKNEQFSVLRKYFMENRVSQSLMGRVWAALQQTMGRSKRRVHEEDIQILQLLPWTLKTELQEEVYSPILTAHPLFSHYSSHFKMQMRKLYQNILQVSLGIGQELFNSGESAHTFYLVLSGLLSYQEDTSRGQAAHTIMVSVGHWLCEPVLWIHWKHTGQLLATTHCEFLALSCTKVQEVFTQTTDGHESVRHYARMFAKFFQTNAEILTDVWADMDLLQEMAYRSFENEEDDMSSAPAKDASTRRKSVFGGSKPGLNGIDARQIFAMSRNWAKSMENIAAELGDSCSDSDASSSCSSSLSSSQASGQEKRSDDSDADRNSFPLPALTVPGAVGKEGAQKPLEPSGSAEFSRRSQTSLISANNEEAATFRRNRSSNARTTLNDCSSPDQGMGERKRSFASATVGTPNHNGAEHKESILDMVVTRVRSMTHVDHSNNPQDAFQRRNSCSTRDNDERRRKSSEALDQLGMGRPRHRSSLPGDMRSVVPE
eukprot:TRINITY_DN18429_c0_g1_i1.p1 TRINITY_DN18429_c0_g1~~TRINITY_DN18429_c0_g1_i1.p1  ORF type:complete len:1323 (-),score=214.52 TRINITY_DN18429_c0_g1_i1:779-4429(-)